MLFPQLAQATEISSQLQQQVEKEKQTDASGLQKTVLFTPFFLSCSSFAVVWNNKMKPSRLVPWHGLLPETVQ